MNAGILTRHVFSTKKRNKHLNTLYEVCILLGAMLIGLWIRFSVYESGMVISGSMLPTLALNDRMLIDHRESLHGQWRRGDIVVFDPPPTWGGDPGETLVKRIIGLPGDVVEIREGRLMVNNIAVQEEYLREEPDFDAVGPLQLGKKEYFVMGDNRNQSEDSRVNGSVQDNYLHGRMIYRFWPPSRFGALTRPDYGDLGDGSKN